MNTLQGGKIICFSSGEYSDYGYNGHFLTLQDITPKMMQEAADDARAAHKKADAACSW